MKAAFSYIRFSTPEQARGDSFRRQSALAEEWAAANGYRIVKSWLDLGVSGFKGKNAKTGDFAKFLQAAEAKTLPPDAVLLIEDLDRMSRQEPDEALSLFLRVIHLGVGIVTLADGKLYTRASLKQDAMQLFGSPAGRGRGCPSALAHDPDRSCDRGRRLADFIFYGLGGEFDRWKDAASRCTAVRLEVETASSTLTLHRAIGTRQEPVSVYYGPLIDSLDADIDAWQRFPIRRPPGGNDLSITQVLFRAIGLPEAPSTGNSNVTMHQVMRLLYADQQTPPGKLFRFESFDTRDIREVVGQLLIGVNGYDLYENQIRLRELKAEYADKNRDYNAAVAALPSSEGVTSVAMLDARSGALAEEKAKVLAEIANADDLVGADQTGEFAADRRTMQTKLRTVAVNLNRLEERTTTLSDEIGEIEQFAAYLEDQLETLSATDELADKIGNIEFQYCPACLKPLEDGEPGHCIVCHQVLDIDEVKSKYFEIRIDTELQIRESRQLLDAKNAQLLVAQSSARTMRREYTELLTEFTGRYDVSNSPRESFLAERNRRIGRISHLPLRSALEHT